VIVRPAIDIVAQPAPKSRVNTSARDGAANPVDKIAVAKANARTAGAIIGRDLKISLQRQRAKPDQHSSPAALPPGWPALHRRVLLEFRP